MLDALHKACRLNEVSEVHSIVKNNPALVNQVDPQFGWTPLYRSVLCGNFDVVECLLAYGAEPNIKNRQGETPLHQAASSNQPRIVRLLLQYDADPNSQQVDGETPLHLAAKSGSQEVIDLLLEHAADPNRVNFVSGKTPLYLALEHGQAKVAKTLRGEGNAPQEVIQEEEEEAIPEVVKATEHSEAELPGEPECEQMMPATNDGNSLYMWLRERNLQTLYLTLHNNGFDDLALLVNNVRAKKDALTLDMLQQIGIEKVGHRHRLLAALHQEAWPQVYSEPSSNCCWCTRSKRAPPQLRSLPTLEEWLAGLNLERKKDAFVQAGFDEFEQLLLVARSEFPLTHEVLEKDLGIAYLGHRHRVLGNLQHEVENYSSSVVLAESTESSPWCSVCAIF